MKEIDKPQYKLREIGLNALDDAKMELYRRYAGPYEDQKIIDNGDIMD